MGEKVYGIRFELEGVDKTVRDTKSVIYLLNAVRLSVKDIQLVLDPSTRSIQNMFWTAIQLTRTWTHFYRLVKLVSKEQDAVLAKSLAIRAASAGGAGAPIGGAARIGPGLSLLAGQAVAFAGMHPLGTAVIIGATAYGLYYWQTEQAKQAHRERMREIARRQGLEP